MLDAQLDRLHTLVGRIATEFSAIEALWYLTFTCLLPKAPRGAVDVIFDQFKTGKQQREVILAVAGATLPKDSALLQSIKDLAKRTWDVADRRNDALHSVLIVQNTATPPRIGVIGISKRPRLADKDIPAEIASLYRAVTILELDMNELRFNAIQHAHPEITHEVERQHLERARQRSPQKFETDQILRAVEGRP